jgi:hypothetical protein
MRKFSYSGEILRSDHYLRSRNLSGRETIMTFTLHVVRFNETAARAVVDAGLLEVLADVVVHGFEGWDSDAVATATRVLAALTEYSAILSLLQQRNVAWPYHIPGLRPWVMAKVEAEGEQVLYVFLGNTKRKLMHYYKDLLIFD